MGSKAFFYKVSEYDQETPQSHTADQPRHREEELQNTKCHKTSGEKQPTLSSNQVDCKNRMTKGLIFI